MVASDHDLFSKLAVAASMSTGHVMDVFLDDYAQIHQLGGLTPSKLRISTSDIASALQMLSVGVVLNDLSFLTLTGGEDHLVNALTWAGVRLYLGVEPPDIKIVLPNENIKNAILNSKGSVYLGFICRNDEPATHLLRAISPLIERGRVIYTPERMLMYRKSGTDDGEITWDALNVQEGSSDCWKVADEPNTVGMYVDPTDNRQYTELCQLVVPFITGVNFVDLARILDDEGDLLIEFRAELRKIVEDASAGKKIPAEIMSDVINPRMQKIGRRFRAISNAKRLRLGGAVVGVASLSLVSYMMSPSFLPTLVTSIGGGGGVAYLAAKEYADFRTGREALRDDPTYLLWRLRQIRSQRQLHN